MEYATHCPISPRCSGVIEPFIRINGRDQDARRVQPQPAGDHPVRANEERWPTALFSRRVTAADPHVVVRRRRVHRGAHRDFGECRTVVDPVQPRADIVSHRLETARRHVASVVGVKHELDTPAFVFSVQLRITVVVADQGTASNSSDGEHAEMAPWAVVGEVTPLAGPVAGAEHLVVTVEEFAPVGNDVEAVVRFVPPRESMRRPKDDPEPQLAR